MICLTKKMFKNEMLSQEMFGAQSGHRWPGQPLICEDQMFIRILNTPTINCNKCLIPPYVL